VYRGSGPFDNRAKVWCQTLHRCQGRMCRLQLGDDGVLKALLGDLHVWSLAFSYEAPQYKVITAPERLPERNGAGIPIRQGLESGWALQQGLVLLASDGHHCAFISQEGRLCNARWNISNGGCTVAAECHPRVLSLSAKKRSLLRAPVYSLLLDSFDGQLRMTMEDASTTKVERYELWSIALEPCALASCALMPTSGGDITVSSLEGEGLSLLECFTLKLGQSSSQCTARNPVSPNKEPVAPRRNFTITTRRNTRQNVAQCASSHITALLLCTAGIAISCLVATNFHLKVVFYIRMYAGFGCLSHYASLNRRRFRTKEKKDLMPSILYERVIRGTATCASEPIDALSPGTCASKEL